MRIRLNELAVDLLSYLFMVQYIYWVNGSEFPERECCDTIFSSPPNPEPVQPTQSTIIHTQIIPSTATNLTTGTQGKPAIAILSCILARQLCFEDPSCSAILEIIPRVCGPVPVACSTVTVTKCLAALKTLQAFPFFRPTCLCKEPGLDPECNNFQDFLFDHPCGLVRKKEKDPYPIDALPTCNHALAVCQQSPKCIELFESFKIYCKVRDNKCRMEDKNLCYEAWSKMRLSPMFGCICPNNHIKRRCDRIFSMVNHNPCVAHSMSLNHFTEQIFDDAIIDNKITAISANDMKNHHDFLYPYNLTVFRTMPTLDNVRFSPGTEAEKYEKSLSTFSLAKNIDSLQITCDSVYQICKSNAACSEALKPVIQYCDFHICNQNACLDALQAFYRLSNEDFTLDIAFCVCNKLPHHSDSCLRAQEKLHPTCAKSPDLIDMDPSNGAVYTSIQPACHTVAEVCRNDASCRSRLEQYEQSCAIDSSTLKCAGHPSACRTAILGILGTPLRTTCSCHNTDLVYECLGWYRLLWLNTCVAETQLDFHLKRFNEVSVSMASKPENNIDVITSSTTRATTTRTTSTHATKTTTTLFRKSSDNRVKFHKVNIIQTTTPMTVVVLEKVLVSTQPVFPEKFDVQTNENVLPQKTIDYNSIAEEFTDQNDTVIDLIMQTQLKTEPITTPEPRYCIVQRPRQSDQLISVNNARRIYSLDDAECSELCFCTDSLVLTCHALCVPIAPCRTALAFYSHASPAYQAFRGRCLCYSGKFICMRPPPGDYALPGGIFLLLGYSSMDEELLRAYTNLGIQDTIRAFQQYIYNHIDNQSTCVLSALNLTDENAIISVRLQNYSNATPMEAFDALKDQCISVMEQISYDINSQSAELMAHQLLSVYKMAEVQIVSPEVNCSPVTFSLSLLSLLSLTLSITQLLMPLLSHQFVRIIALRL
ncbi:uncharacterized protein LOC129578351 isoform X1 [Sitodiplosis mosellana]|uniref:uncharacterized protein LOC129578351 isoform X1 n=1 Tax=Sitodiplosis mosellana TaxID=263140 RepID=UPI002443B253|nr:uncharacterized protein LOC129578351 isoform X1 [Sitodiplosis mosellana]